MTPALITGASAAIAYLAVVTVRTIREYQHERANRRAWNMYRSNH